MVAVLGGALALVAACLTVSAAASTQSGATPTHTRFPAQARALGLSSSQADALQARINAELKASGGTQTAINKISYADGALLLPLPGELRARDVTKPKSDPARGCPQGEFCAYSDSNFAGAIREWDQCGSYYDVPFESGGSWYNNEAAGTVATMFDGSHSVVYVTPPAPSSDPNGDWSPVRYVSPC